MPRGVLYDEPRKRNQATMTWFTGIFLINPVLTYTVGECRSTIDSESRFTDQQINIPYEEHYGHYWVRLHPNQRNIVNNG